VPRRAAEARREQGRRRAPHAATTPDPAAHPAQPPPSASFPALHHPDVAHFLNLTNGLEAAPLLRELRLPYTLVRLPSTLCEQQRFDALAAGADTALLAAAALGRTCLVWDFGSRGLASRGGPPRAVWYGLEFLAYACHRKWFPRRGEGSGLGPGPGPGPGPPSAGDDPPPSHRRAFLRGNDVTPIFEAALRGGRGWGTSGAESPAEVTASSDGGTAAGGWRFPLPPGFDPAISGVSKSTVKRLRYFRRFVPPCAPPATHVRLYGAHKPTPRDNDVGFYVSLATAECGPAGGSGAAGAGVVSVAADPPSSVTGPDGRVCPAALAADLGRLGFGLFTGGVPHAREGGVPAAADAARARGWG